MKKIIFTFLFMLNLIAFAADNIHLMALEDFDSTKPKKNFSAQVIEDAHMDGIFLIKGDIIHCTLQKTKDPKRAKQDAKAYFNIVSYEDSEGTHKIASDLTGRYAKSVLNKEKVKDVSPKNVVKKTAGFVGDHLLFQGISYGLSFVDGVIENPEDNRLKSGVKQVYDDSVLSYIEYGEDISLKKGDTFYFVVKPTRESELERQKELNEVKQEQNIEDESGVETKKVKAKKIKKVKNEPTEDIKKED